MCYQLADVLSLDINISVQCVDQYRFHSAPKIALIGDQFPLNRKDVHQWEALIGDQFPLNRKDIHQREGALEQDH